MIKPLKEIDNNTDFSGGVLLLLNKPCGITSFKLVRTVRSQIKKNYGIRAKLKVGHAGTLDPLASGLMIICTGKMTRKIQELQDTKKTYEGWFTLGATTPSLDMETTVDQTFPTDHLTEEAVRKAFEAFTGELKQTPPVYSAVKIKGRRAYDYARTDTPVTLRERQVIIHSLELLSFKENKAEFRITCSKGTYIRALARDLGEHLQSGAYLGKLVRTKVGPYSLQEAFSPEVLEKKLIQGNQTGLNIIRSK